MYTVIIQNITCCSNVCYTCYHIDMLISFLVNTSSGAARAWTSTAPSRGRTDIYIYIYIHTYMFYVYISI